MRQPNTSLVCDQAAGHIKSASEKVNYWETIEKGFLEFN